MLDADVYTQQSCSQHETPLGFDLQHNTLNWTVHYKSRFDLSVISLCHLNSV